MASLVHAAIDDLGDVGLLCGEELDLDLQAPLSGGRVSLHLTLTASFHGGAVWVRDGVEPLVPGTTLRAGDVDLLSIVPSRDAATTSLRLRLARTVHWAVGDPTVRSLWLLPAGASGRLRIEPAELEASVGSSLAGPIDLSFDPETPALCVASEAGLGVDGEERGELSLPLPLPARRRVTVRGGPAGRPPWSLALRSIAP